MNYVMVPADKAANNVDLFLFCYERDFMMSLSDDKQADVIGAFNTTSRYLDGILNINNVYFDNMVSSVVLMIDYNQKPFIYMQPIDARMEL